MAKFLLQFLTYTAVLATLAVPAVVRALRQGKRSTARNFAAWAAITGCILAVLKLTSDELVQNCLDAGNTQCVDYGSTGMFVLFGGGYVLTAWIRAYTMGR